MIRLNQSRKFRKYYNKLIPGGSTFSKVEYFNDQNVPFALSRCKDAKVYDIPVKKYKILKDEIAFLSANTWDVSGGGNYGYQAIWVNRNNNIFDNLDFKPKLEIKNLSGLLTKL